MSVASAFGNITAIMVEVVALIPYFVDLIIQFLPVIIILIVIGFIAKFFKQITGMLKFKF